MEYNKMWKIGISMLVLVLFMILFLTDIVGELGVWLFTFLVLGFFMGFYLVKDIGWYEREIVVFGGVLLGGIFISGFYLRIGLLAHFLMLITGLISGLFLYKYQQVGIGGGSIIFLGMIGIVGVELGLLILTLSESLLRSLEIVTDIASPIISSISLGIIFSLLLVWHTNILRACLRNSCS